MEKGRGMEEDCRGGQGKQILDRKLPELSRAYHIEEAGDGRNPIMGGSEAKIFHEKREQRRERER